MKNKIAIVLMALIPILLISTGLLSYDIKNSTSDTIKVTVFSKYGTFTLVSPTSYNSSYSGHFKCYSQSIKIAPGQSSHLTIKNPHTVIIETGSLGSEWNNFGPVSTKIGAGDSKGIQVTRDKYTYDVLFK